MSTRISLDNFDAIVLDFDGVIIDSERAQLRAWTLAADTERIALSDLRLENIAGRLDEDIVVSLLPDYDDDLRSTVLRRKKSIVHSMYEKNEIALIPGAAEFIHDRTRSHVLAVASNSRSGVVVSVLEKYGLGDAFSAIVTAGGSLPSKPHPAIYFEVLRRIQVDGSQSIVIEDSLDGLRSARAAACRTIGIATNLPMETLIPLADWVIDSFRDLE